MITHNLRDLKNLVPVAKAKPNSNIVIVNKKYYFHHLQVSPYALNQSEFEAKVWETIVKKYNEVITFKSKNNDKG